MVERSRLREATALSPEDRKAAGAVGRFHHPGRKAGLADQGRLLVAGDAADRDRAAEQRRGPILGRAVAHLGQQRDGHAEQRAQFAAPGIGVDIVEGGAGRIGGVGRVHGAGGQPPEQE
jgi:hypothetical protein